MKVLISNAVWGKTYCSIFTRFSLATLLAGGNIPELAKRVAITFHIVTTRRDRRRLSEDPAIAELQRYCRLEWEVIEDFGIYLPPQGPGGEKYPFLSALQNIAIARALDHDAIVFNYADFIWSDGSLTNSVRKLADSVDAVLAFCVPVDRDSALPVLERYRCGDDPRVVDLPPRDGAQVIIDHMHQEAKRRLWTYPGFTVTPSYLIWEVGTSGLVIRAYHQSVLVMRVDRESQLYRQGIVRGSLDGTFSAQLAKTGSVVFANDSDEVLVFSLYDTPVNSKMPLGMTREMSLRKLLEGDVLPEQRIFATFPILLGHREKDQPGWARVLEESQGILRQAEGAFAFDPKMYDKNLETHGTVPKLSRGSAFRRRLVSPIVSFSLDIPASRILIRIADTSAYAARRGMRIAYVLLHPSLLFAAVNRRIRRFLPRARGAFVAPNIWIKRQAVKALLDAADAEDLTRSVTDSAQLNYALRNAEQALRAALQIAPIWADLWRSLGRNLWFQARFDEAIEVWTRAESLRDEMARQAGWAVDECVTLPRNCAISIGLMGHLDGFVKRKILAGDTRPYYLVAPPEEVVNAAFLDYWRDHICIVPSLEELKGRSATEAVYGVNWNWVVPQNGRHVFVHAGLSNTQRAWEKEGRPPLLTLSSAHAALLQAARKRWGMADQDRLVCLHVRTEGFYGSTEERAQTFRNTPISDYYPLIDFLTEQGLWVIRMGDASMPPLELDKCRRPSRVLDYALSMDKSDELDVALSATCELFISSPSGLHTVAHAFGRPVCEVNFPIYQGFPWHSDDIFIPQRYFSHAKNRFLTLAEILSGDIIHLNHQFLLQQAGISLIPNDPEDIVEAVREALSPATYRVSDASRANEVLAAFDALNGKHDVGISGRLGRHFAAKYATELLDADKGDELSKTPVPQKRKLDFLVPCFNRPAYVHHILKTGLACNIPGADFVVLDDASNIFESVADLGSVTTEMVCRSFNDPRVIYWRSDRNMGVAAMLEHYFRHLCEAEYSSLLNPKDEFIDGAPIIQALAKLDADPSISFVVYPLRQVDRVETDKGLLFDYSRMTGREFISAHIRDSALQHCSGYAIIRVSALRKAGIPRNLDLRSLGLEDGSGIDHEMIYNVATTGDVDFASAPPLRRRIVGGYTEQYPLTFAYTQYQYARRLMAELEPRGFVSAEDRRRYLSFWHLIIARGLVVVYRPAVGTVERGVRRIKGHLKVPILLYLIAESVRFRVWPRSETVVTCLRAARAMWHNTLNRYRGRPYIR